MNELSVVINQKPGSIDFNFEELKVGVQNIAVAYQGVELTEDSTKEGKESVATLRKIEKALEDKRKEIKKEWMKPYEDLEKKVKELISIIDKPILSIDNQVKAFEEKKKAEKKQEITKIYDELVGDMLEFLPLRKIYDSKWENVGTTMKSIKESITQVVDSTSMAVQTIKAMNSEYVSKALEQYKYDLSLPDAIASINRYELQRKEILEREEAKRKAEEERKARIKAEEEQKAKNRAEEEERRKRELEAERIMHENHIQEEKKVILEEANPCEVGEAPFEPAEKPFAVEKPFIVTKKTTIFEVTIDEDLETTLISFLSNIGATCRRIS